LDLGIIELVPKRLTQKLLARRAQTLREGSL
jgi:hypothetical protein